VTLEELCTVMDVDFVVRYRDCAGHWMADFDNGEIKEGCGLLSATGRGKTINEAINDYLRQVRGKRIVLHAMSKERRREFIVPETTTFGGAE
jgi:hypothetical protein